MILAETRQYGAATANPIVDFLQEAILASPCERHFTSMKAYMYSLVIKDCNEDMAQVEDKVRSILPKRGTSIKRAVQPIRALYDILKSCGDNNGGVYAKALEMLKS